MSPCNTLSSGTRESLNNLGDMDCNGYAGLNDVVTVYQMYIKNEKGLNDVVNIYNMYRYNINNELQDIINNDNGIDEDTATTPPITTTPITTTPITTSHDIAIEYINSNSPSTKLTIINVIHGDVCDIFFYGEEVLEYKVQFNKTFNQDDIIKTTENKAIFHNLFKNANLVDYPDQASKLSEIDSQTYFYQARMSNEMYEPKGHNKYSNSIDDVTKNWEKNVLIHMFSTTNNNNIISINSLRYKSGSNSFISLDLDVDVGIHNL